MHTPAPDPARRPRRHARKDTCAAPAVRELVAPVPPPPLDRSERCATVARWFGLDRAARDSARARQSRRARDGAGEAPSAVADPESLAPSRTRSAPSDLAGLLAPGTITLVSGPSGSGKSSLLRQLRQSEGLNRQGAEDAEKSGTANGRSEAHGRDAHATEAHHAAWHPSVAWASRPCTSDFKEGPPNAPPQSTASPVAWASRPSIRAERPDEVAPRRRGGPGEEPQCPPRPCGAAPSVKEPLAAASARAGRPSHGEAAACCDGRDPADGPAAPVRWLDLATLSPPDLPLVDCFGDAPLRDVLRLLGRVGLGEAWTYLRTPAELSDGQRWRLRLALALHHAGASASADAVPGRKPLAEASAPASTPRAVLVVDEFAALLDRLTARVVARLLRHVVDASRGTLAALVATSHDDLVDALAPDVLIRCDFGRISVRRCG